MNPLGIAQAGAGLLSGLFGGGSGYKKVSNFDKNQKEFFKQFMRQLQGMGGGYQQSLGILQDYLNPESELYREFEKPYLDEFQQKTVPGLAETFAGFGGGEGGALSSSGFGQALGAAGANLQTNLAQMKRQKQFEALQALLGQYNTMSGMGLGAQPYSYMEKGPNMLQSILGGFSGMKF